MSKFEETKWADSRFSRSYRDDADIYIPFRYQCLEISKSLYRHFISQNAKARILDLGCGDGLFIQELLKSFTASMVTLVDGSAEMLEAAKVRLGNEDIFNYTKASFQDLLTDDPLNDTFDFVYSSFSVHHLPFKEKKELYSYIHKRLSPGGCFMNYDVVCPPVDGLESWYFSLWRLWIKEYLAEERREELLGTPEKYKGDPENMPDTLESQLEALKNVGFNNVDCYFKYGIFCLFGGSKEV